jgi:hypothetical protein
MSQLLVLFVCTFVQVDVRFERKLQRPIFLQELKHCHSCPGNPLQNLILFKQTRLSVCPLTDAQFEYIVGLESVSAGMLDLSKRKSSVAPNGTSSFTKKPKLDK